MLSIIIPIFDAERTLAQTIECVLQQSFSDFELILIDDGSRDSSYSICKRYAEYDKRIKIHHKENEGASAARNDGIEQASHEYITFIDADDTVSNDYLQELVNDLANYQDVDFLIQGLIQKWPASSRKYVLKDNHYDFRLKNCTEFFKNVYLNDFSGPYCKLYRRSIVNSHNLRFSKNIIYAEDLDFTLRYLLHCKTVVTSSKANYTYLMHAGSVSSRIYSFEEELSGLRQLYSSYSSIVAKFHSIELKNMMNKSICDYFLRVIYSNYRHGYNRKNRIMNLKLLSDEELLYFKKSYIADTLFMRVVKSLFVNRNSKILDMILSSRL